MIDKAKYDKLFIDKFKANAIELNQEFSRITTKFGDTEEIRRRFYIEAFETLIVQFRSKLAKDEYFEYIISTLYQLFIDQLVVS